MSIELLKKMTGEEDTQLLMLLQTRATNLILSETNRTSLTPALSLLIPEVAIELHNRSGAEGEHSRTEGGIASSLRRKRPVYGPFTAYTYA
ncbi:Phage gp6-like head-tail connector protein [Streptococcus pneumoniae]|nr:Phage gp6-like head-tail connector protein [Streptococcus pneumoniae]